MFLWVRLVLMSLENAFNIQELRGAIETFPSELGKLYGQIMQMIRARITTRDYDKVLRVLGWMAFAKRPLKAYELQYGAILHLENTIISHETKPLGNILDICKPLAEDGMNQTVIFVHSSVKE
jgi:hypothetical protein